jgi:hypothetical protein
MWYGCERDPTPVAVGRPRVRARRPRPQTVPRHGQASPPINEASLPYVCIYYCSTYYKAVRVGKGGSGGHVLRETTSRGLCGLVCPSRTSERGGEGDCVKEGGGEEGKRERERAGG